MVCNVMLIHLSFLIRFKWNLILKPSDMFAEKLKMKSYFFCRRLTKLSLSSTHLMGVTSFDNFCGTQNEFSKLPKLHFSYNNNNKRARSHMQYRLVYENIRLVFDTSISCLSFWHSKIFIINTPFFFKYTHSSGMVINVTLHFKSLGSVFCFCL